MPLQTRDDYNTASKLIYYYQNTFNICPSDVFQLVYIKPAIWLAYQDCYTEMVHNEVIGNKSLNVYKSESEKLNAVAADVQETKAENMLSSVKV